MLLCQCCPALQRFHQFLFNHTFTGMQCSRLGAIGAVKRAIGQRVVDGFLLCFQRADVLR